MSDSPKLYKIGQHFKPMFEKTFEANKAIWKENGTIHREATPAEFKSYYPEAKKEASKAEATPAKKVEKKSSSKAAEPQVKKEA